MKLSVVIPVYNEKATILELIKRVNNVPLEKEIIIVDDCSIDGTREVLQNFSHNNVKIFFHQTNQGKGAALRTGFSQVQGDIVIIQDADLEYNPDEYPHIIAPIKDGHADAVFGSRFLGGPHRVHLFWHYVGNTLLTTLSNMFTNINLTDMETCYKAFRATLLPQFTIESDRFGIEPEITAKFARLRCRIYEVPISYSGRDYTEGKKIGWKDGLAAIYWIIYYNLKKSLHHK
ncbi:MAG: glycosyltransferase family 2 protein [Proteobacteria bacterium]|nr:glycosyltransferase family 2 protein [Pseudomonadota bacterium]